MGERRSRVKSKNIYMKDSWSMIIEGVGCGNGEWAGQWRAMGEKWGQL